jgi:hypothetical protein
MVPETPPLHEMARDAVELIRGWRSEVEPQWTHAALKVDPQALADVLECGRALGVEPLMTLCAVLACEWLYRARRATPEDIEAELWGIRNGLASSRNGSLSPDQAALVAEALRLEVTKQLRSRRFLVSLRTWAVPASGLPFRSGRLKQRPGAMPDAPLPLVRMKRGPIPNLGPIVAAVIAAGMAHRATGSRPNADKHGAQLAHVLLRRGVLLPEFRGWQAKLKSPISDPLPGSPRPEERATLGLWLVDRFSRHYNSLGLGDSWETLQQGIARDPAWAFVCAGDAGLAAQLYAIGWG